MRMGPPNALECPNPMSSINTMTTLGAPAGGFTSNRAGAFASRASSVEIACTFGSAMGNTVRLIRSTAGPAFPPRAESARSADEQPDNIARDADNAANIGRARIKAAPFGGWGIGMQQQSADERG